MIHDTLRACLIIAVLAAAASILVETRQRLAILDLSARMVAQQPQMMPMPACQPVPQPEPGRLQRFGRATLDLADAALGVIR